MNTETKIIEILEPVVDAHKEESYHEILGAIDELYNNVMSDPTFDEKHLEESKAPSSDPRGDAGVSREGGVAAPHIAAAGHNSNLYSQLKYTHGGMTYPQGRYG